MAINELNSQSLNDKQLLFLATKLAPLLPLIALKVIGNMKKPNLLLKASLLMDINHHQEAENILNSIKDKKQSSLLLANLQEQNHHKRLDYMWRSFPLALVFRK